MSEFTEFITDCLVFKLEEIDNNTGKIDNTIYIIYDKKNHNYLIRGNRNGTRNAQSHIYSFECEYANDLADFLKYMICSENSVNEILYNYDNFPENPNEITFGFLYEHDDITYEMSGYNDKKLKRRRLLRNLRMLRNVYNHY